MPATKSSPFITASLRDAVSTDAGTQSPATLDYWQGRAAREKWQSLIDHQLIEWGRDPSQFEDEGIEPPTLETIQRAIRLAQVCKAEGFSVPDSVVPDPNGGIVFERGGNGVSEVFHVWDDGPVEYLRFQGTQLVERLMLC